MDDQVLVRVLHRRADLRKQLERAGTGRLRNSVDGSPSMYSMTKNGLPVSVVPPSISRAMFGCLSLARICRSRGTAAAACRRCPCRFA